MDSAPVLFFETLPSTNRTAKELALQGYPEGTVVVAQSQTQGRGRGCHHWHSPLGGLYLSVLLQPREQRPCTDLMFLGGLAVVQAISALCPELRPGLKWPNDCLVDGHKVGGVLGESVPGVAVSVLGIGLNVDTEAAQLRAFTNNPFPATSLRAVTGRRWEVGTFRQKLLERLFPLYIEYHQKGFSALKRQWEKACVFLHAQVTFQPGAKYREEEKQGSSDRPFTGRCLGIDEEGALVLLASQGVRRHYLSGEIGCYS